MSVLDNPDALVEPAFWHCPPYVETIGPDVADLVRLFGRVPNPEQQLLLDGSFGMDRRGRLTAFEVFVLCSRQNLKTGFFEFRALGKALLLRRPVQIWTAHKESATDQALADFKEMIESSSELSRRVRRITEGKGSKSLEFVNGCTIVFRPRTGKAGQSMSADDVDLDEYFAVEPKHLGSLVPTLSTRPRAQVGGASSAPHVDSKAQRTLMARGRAAAEGRSAEPRLLYGEWSVQRRIGLTVEGKPRYGPPPCKAADCSHLVDAEGCIADDRELIKLANPSAGRSSAPAISWEYLADERRTLCGDAEGVAEYFKERLGAGVEDAGLEGTIFPTWPTLAKAVPEPLVVLALGIACDNDQTVLSLGSACRGVEHPHLAINDRRPATDRAGFAANVARIQQQRKCPVLIRGKNFLIDDLTRAGVKLTLVDADQRAQSHTDLASAIENAQLEHGDYPELDDAIKAAHWQVLDNRRNLDSRKGEISALESVAFALRGATVPTTTETWGFYS